MHRIFESEGWEVEMLRNADKDPDTGTRGKGIDERLQGCCFIEMRRTSNQYLAELHFEELEHNALFLIEADVLRKRGEDHEYTNGDLYYFRRRKITGTSGEAAEVAKKYQTEIDESFFGKTERNHS
ncbi:hypothetical protein HYS49_03345 [Candidatus Woesearchaeota archaeon]|nr:hypothetical protein [Candidatus Woesearchaeota archaeon]